MSDIKSNVIPDIKLSVSKAKVFADCKRKYKYSYIDKLPKKEYEFHTFGKLCHKVLEDFHRHYIDGGTEPYHTQIGKCFNSALAEYAPKVTPEMKKECYEIINKYLMMISSDKKMGAAANVIAVEKDFNLVIKDKVLLNGFIDRVQLDADGVIHVADYKTSKNDKYLKNDFFQLLTYAYVMCLEDANIQTVRTSYVMLRMDFKYVTKDFSRKEIMKVEDKFIEYADNILAEKMFRPTPTILCKWCDFLDICESGKALVNPSAKYGETKW